MKGVLESAYMLGMPLCYSGKVLAAFAISIFVGIMAGVVVLISLLSFSV